MAGKYYGVKRSDAFLAHYGILGMKWGSHQVPRATRSYEDTEKRKS